MPYTTNSSLWNIFTSVLAGEVVFQYKTVVVREVGMFQGLECMSITHLLPWA